ncbi:MAG TPA: tetratricopeptide repeat protein [Methylomirabilota bacterium]|nr:tetratricopeptide repeat protein [Methylomirabilota bacterium]
MYRRIRPAGSLGLPAVVFWALLLSGCATGDESVQHDLAQLRQDLSAVNLAVHRSKGETETAVGQLDRRTREQAAENTKQLQTLSARLDSLTAELNSLSARLDELAQRLDNPSRPGGGGSPPRPGPPPVPSPSGGGRSSGGPSSEESYKAAYLDFSKGNYSLAIASFREFVRRFPDAPQADSAQYWIGESYVASAHAAATQGQADKAREALQQAVQEYRRVFVNYPRGTQVPTALYKEALALEELKQVKLAQARLQYLVDNFPQSQEAPLARERLKSLAE